MPIISFFSLGFRDSFVYWLIVAPFGALFGALSIEAGLNLVQTMTMSILVIAGASQFTALSLLENNTPTLIILLAATAVNLRMAMYSAGLTPHLGGAPLGLRALYAYFMIDQTFATAINKYENTPQMTLTEKGAYYSGSFLCIAPVWYLCSFLGALFGAKIPPEYALDFAIPICFIALCAPLIRSIAHFSAAITSIIGALLFINIPYNLGLLIAAFIAMLVGVRVEIWMKKRRKNA